MTPVNNLTEDKMAGWHHRLDGQEFEQALGVGDGQGGLECCSPWGRKESDMTERLKNLPASAGNAGSIPGSGCSPGEGNGNPLWYSCLESPKDRRGGGLQSKGLQRVT